MATHRSRFNRLLLILVVGLYLISLAAFSYGEWRANPEPVLWMMARNALILSLPLALVYGSVYILIRAWRERHQTGELSTRFAKVIHWAPRVAALVIIFFVSLFSLDVFEMQARPPRTAGGVHHAQPAVHRPHFGTGIRLAVAQDRVYCLSACWPLLPAFCYPWPVLG